MLSYEMKKKRKKGERYQVSCHQCLLHEKHYKRLTV